MQIISIREIEEFAAARRIKKKLFVSERMKSEILFYEPGQGTPEHVHPTEDEIFYVIDGHGTFTVDGETIEAGATSLLFVPAGARHGLSADTGSRFVVMLVRAPGRAQKRAAAPK